MILACLLVMPLPSRAGWSADPDDALQLKVEQALDVFREQQPEIDDFLSQAVGYAVFPNVVKIGAMWGGAYGKGLLIEQDQAVGRCSQWLGSLGAQLGAQSYRQLILFRTPEALETFKRGRIEFNGRASAVAVTAGGAVDPAHLPDVAIFSLARGGLMAELSAAGVKYNYRPFKTTAEAD
jgi:lipid-binding SYLF domain-containing protein